MFKQLKTMFGLGKAAEHRAPQDGNPTFERSEGSVTFTVANHASEQVVEPMQGPLTKPEDLLSATWGRHAKSIRSKELLQSTFSREGFDFSKIVPQHNGFVDTVVKAYNEHHHLVLRPDDVWIAILGQFNFYVNAHAEELRSHFVAHKGKKKISVTAVGTRYTVDFGDLAAQMTDRIDENVVDKELKDWILPNFSTTTHNDTVVSAVLMMATLKAYFSYFMGLTCGIPAVTLLGQRSDWVKLLHRIEKLKSFGEEPKVWASMLRPVLERFVDSYDGTPDMDFWGKICHYEVNMSGSDQICGWITAFCVWSSAGVWQGPALGGTSGREFYDPAPLYRLKLDNVRYGILKTDDIPPGFCEVDVTLDDNGEVFECIMTAGHMARLTGGETGDAVSPLPAWFMFIKENC